LKQYCPERVKRGDFSAKSGPFIKELCEITETFMPHESEGKSASHNSSRYVGSQNSRKLRVFRRNSSQGRENDVGVRVLFAGCKGSEFAG